MNHVHEQSKLDRDDESSVNQGEKTDSYYYDDTANYETYRDDDDDDDESPEDSADD